MPKEYLIRTAWNIKSHFKDRLNVEEYRLRESLEYILLRKSINRDSPSQELCTLHDNGVAYRENALNDDVINWKHFRFTGPLWG